MDGVAEGLNPEDPKPEPQPKEEPLAPAPAPTPEPKPEPAPEADPVVEPVVEDTAKDEKIKQLNAALAAERAEKRELKSLAQIPPKDEGTPMGEHDTIYGEDELQKVKEQAKAEIKADMQSSASKEIEQQAMQNVFNKYPALLEENLWNDVVRFYTPAHGKTNFESEVKNIELAYSNYRASLGYTPSSGLAEAKAEGAREAIADAAAADMANLPGGPAVGQQEVITLSEEEKHSAKKGGLTDKEYMAHKGEGVFEIPIHEDAPPS